ncbi:hypothetical protein SAMN05192571_104134 [Pleomorphomonas diazotrophica]|uniref:hypothetical protein n=1 Tax=Pleomorphomonas diazotrophica TaxID=1166257 RepID=UPI0008DF8DAC|nr:hypothetical protein [Pleomorphomonas diazotrophica]SFM67762.1 hypothetical protein SAMN05192571_104134 [Pleomorphomonas diazotrophica]
MLSFVARVLGLVLFAIGVVALISDGISSVAADAVVMTPLSGSLSLIAPDFVDRIESSLRPLVGDAAWAEWGSAVLAWPTLAVAGISGIFLMLAGARRPPRATRSHVGFTT